MISGNLSVRGVKHVLVKEMCFGADAHREPLNVAVTFNMSSTAPAQRLLLLRLFDTPKLLFYGRQLVHDLEA